MRKGFTLIELLAVIVILAIIATIATPIVLSIIQDTKESAVLRSAEHYLTAVENSIAKKSLSIGESFSPNICEIQSDGNLLCDEKDTLEVEVSGEVPSSGTITFEKGKIIDVELSLSSKKIWKDPFTGNLTYELVPGLYDKNDKLLLSWKELENEYDFKTLIETNSDEVSGNAASIIDSIDGANKLVIGEGVTSIGKNAFSYCKNLTSITIPTSVTSIGEYSFCFCQSLKIVTIPSSVTTIGHHAFYGCDSLTSITIPDNVTTIDHMAFYGSGLTSVTIPGSITSISSKTFMNCKNLTSITIPNGVTSIDSDAFSGCTALTSITIPDSVTSIGKRAFKGCDSLASVSFENDYGWIMYELASESDAEAIDVTNATTNATNIKDTYCEKKWFRQHPSATFTDGTTLTWEELKLSENGTKYSYGASKITDTTIDGAFYHCQKLKKITIPDSVTTIGEYAFFGSTNLKKITIPVSVTSIQYRAFYATGLSSITFEGTVTQWNNISLSDNWNEEYQGSSIKTVICSDGEITL